MSLSPHENRNISEVTVGLALGALWAQLFLACIYSWRNGDYYEYGWFVPPLAGWLFWRRWKDSPQPLHRPGARSILILASILLPVLLIVRVLGQVDPNWRLPISVHAAVVVCATLILCRQIRGPGFALACVPVLLFALSSVPYPSVVEHALVRNLTGWVVAAACEVLNLLGKPTTLLGDRLESMGRVVEVTDGCSGVRSLQSFLMAGLFFGELHRMTAPRRLVLLGASCVMALAINVGRTLTLSLIDFRWGEEALKRCHDRVGLAAFAASGLLFLGLSAWLARNPAPVRRVRVTGREPAA